MEDLESLVSRASSGDLDAYGEIVRRFQDMAYGYAYAILGDFHLAEDVAQEAFVQAYCDLADLRESAAFPGWFRRIVFTRCDRITRRKHVPMAPLEAASGLAGPGPGPVETAQRRELRKAVLAAIRSLSEDERTAITLFYINGYSQTEIAEFLEVPVSTVKSRLHTSRGRLRRRMVTMVADTFKSHALPDDFTCQTVEKALAEARKLNEQRKWLQAEQVLRDVLKQAPDHPGLLKELNRALQGTWLFLGHRRNVGAEIVEHGYSLMASRGDDEALYQNICDTLLWMPDMPKAIEFIQGWIEKRGTSLASVSRLTWAKGCAGQYDESEATWKELLALAEKAAREDALSHVGRACSALVDCLASAGELVRAQRVLRGGWDFVCHLQPLAQNKPVVFWLRLFGQAHLDAEAVSIAREWSSALESAPDQDVREQGAALMARVWFEDSKAVTADWLDWFQQRLAAQDLDKKGLQRAASVMLLALAETGKLDEREEMGLAMAELLREAQREDLQSLARWVHVTALGPHLRLQAGDLAGAERAAREAVAAGFECEVWWLNDLAILRGEPSPPELMQEIAEKGIDGACIYGLDGWYHVAREAAAAGEVAKAFQALRRACEYWCNPPLAHVKMWEKDTRWGTLRNHAEFTRILAEKRRRIGPIHGELKYSPNW